jgi:pilus assembly protein Flp/PilA
MQQGRILNHQRFEVLFFAHVSCCFASIFVRGEFAMLTYLKNFVREEEGATMVEYGLMVALIAVVSILAVTFIGTSLSEMFTDVGEGIAP